MLATERRQELVVTMLGCRDHVDRDRQDPRGLATKPCFDPRQWAMGLSGVGAVGGDEKDERRMVILHGQEQAHRLAAEDDGAQWLYDKKEES